MWLSNLLSCVSKAQPLKAFQMPLSTNKIHFKIQKEHEGKERENRKKWKQIKRDEMTFEKYGN